ncbi:MAG: aminotransferase class V-fold PLP-dependent enzyme [Pseudomonadota bacterium]|jgi:cysteine desulfurase|nr:aminotransferase class V-fold PLP-dependent enzyme [Pseudomonadota bacterium]|tara:strand:+ start:9337 stop:10884 length:1548 start_codon:yes stop_codon:yes gene_type:complete
MTADWIALDHAATTPLAPGVFEAMRPWLDNAVGNPASDHRAGRAARAAVEAARAAVARLVGAPADSLIWTSGATESINLAIKGALEFDGRAPAHVISSRIEHRATLDTLRWVAGQGHKVSLLSPDARGTISIEAVLAALTPATRLVSLMWVNNELGTCTDMPALAAALRARGVLLHVDAAQAAGWLPIDLETMPIDLLSLSAHKLGGPKGIGALYVCRRPRVRLSPLLHGGGQEQGMRSGTLATHQIVGFGAAATRRMAQREALAADVLRLRDQLAAQLQAGIPDLLRNSPVSGSPHILNVSVPGVDGESLRASLPDLLFSSGSACSSATREPSFVLRALGHDDPLADASLRLSLGEGSCDAEVQAGAARIIAAATRLRDFAAGLPPPAVTGLDNLYGYSPAVWQRFCAADAVGSLAGEGVHAAKATSRADGAWLEIGVQITQERVVAARYRGVGCPVTLAAGQWFAEQITGADVSTLQRPWLLDVRNALEIAPEKSHCAVMVDDLARALWSTPP